MPVQTLVANPVPTKFEPLPAYPWIKGDDPFYRLLKPRSDESASERAQREAQEKESRRVSDEIDAVIETDRKRAKADKRVRVLLLGQSESGKSTVLRNFQLMFCPQAFKEELASWRLVIQLNLVRSIRLILDQLSALESAGVNPFESNYMGVPTTASSPRRNLSKSSASIDISDDFEAPPTPSLSSFSQNGISSKTTAPASTSHAPQLTDRHRTLRMRLLPLLHIESSLLRRLDPNFELEATRLGTDWQRNPKELHVASHSNWKDKLAKLRRLGGGPAQGLSEIDFDDPEDPGHVLHACRDDMIALWKDPIVKQMLKNNGLRLEEMPGFFLDDIERLTSARYVPSEDDVLKARMKTVGMSEHKFQIDLGERVNWSIFDVGGTRTQRAAWQPYFENLTAIIFLAPISSFDQTLVEDKKVNRLEDSLLLFKFICSSQLLKGANVLLFLNKIDILESKLKNGVKLCKYIKSYGERPNELEPVCKFFRSKFTAIHKEYSEKPIKRSFYTHLTNVTDKNATRVLLSSVCDVIFRENLASSHLC